MQLTKLSENEIKKINKLYKEKERTLTNTFLIEGPHLIKEAQELNLLIKAYTIDPNLEGILISESDMKKICQTSSVVKMLGIAKIKENGPLTNKILALDRIQDPGNLGTLLRSAKAFGFDTILLNKGTVDIYNPKVIRSCQGAIFKLNIIYDDILNFIESHKDYLYFGTDVRRGIDVTSLKKPAKFMLILGNEGQGVDPKILEKTTNNLYIKLDSTESLNVSVAGGILMYMLK